MAYPLACGPQDVLPHAQLQACPPLPTQLTGDHEAQPNKMAVAPGPLQPTWRGHISSTMDALVLFEACLEGRLTHVPRRPHDREREELIRSGNVFIYEEHASGIKRWTDGYNWSPSRILGNFLIYRELEKAFPPGEKKKALKKKTKAGVNKAVSPNRPNANNINAAVASINAANTLDAQSESQRALIGSLVDSYPFKEDGLVKKTISVHWNGIPHHLVSYYKVDDVQKGDLQPPSRDPSLSNVIPRSGLISAQNFRVPVDQDEFAIDDRSWPFQQQPMYPSNDMSMMYTHRSYSVPNVGAPMYPNQYALPHHAHPQISPMQQNVYPNHYPSHVNAVPASHGYDPVRHSLTARHSISASPGMSSDLGRQSVQAINNDFSARHALSNEYKLPIREGPNDFKHVLGNDFGKQTLNNNDFGRRASTTVYDPSLVTSAGEFSGLPAVTTLPTADSRPPPTSYFPSLSGYAHDDYPRPPTATGSAENLKFEHTRTAQASMMPSPNSTPGLTPGGLGIEHEERGSWPAQTYQEYNSSANNNSVATPNNQYMSSPNSWPPNDALNQHQTRAGTGVLQ